MEKMEEMKRQLGHPFIRERRAAINALAAWLQDPAARDEALALLLDRAKNDPITILREQAEEVLANAARQHPEWRLGEGAVYIFGVNCPVCHHTSYFDRRVVCAEHREIYRGKEPVLHHLLLHCQHGGHEMTWNVDCEGIN